MKATSFLEERIQDPAFFRVLSGLATKLKTGKEEVPCTPMVVMQAEKMSDKYLAKRIVVGNYLKKDGKYREAWPLYVSGNMEGLEFRSEEEMERFLLDYAEIIRSSLPEEVKEKVECVLETRYS